MIISLAHEEQLNLKIAFIHIFRQDYSGTLGILILRYIGTYI